MSKAFTREDDIAAEPILRPQFSSLPPGVKNYLTRDGARQLQEELNRLTEIERPFIASLPEDEAETQLPILNQRIVYLGQSLQSAEIVSPPDPPHDVVRFGATVTVRSRVGEESKYRIVGVDETDLARDWVSWRSPIAGALLNARLGGRVKFKFPAGEEVLEIVDIKYE